MVGATRFEDEGKSLCWVQQHDSSGLSTVVAEKLDGNQVVHIIREIEKNIVILERWHNGRWMGKWKGWRRGRRYEEKGE